MKKIILLLTLNMILVGFSFGQKTKCGDGITYSNETQTKNDERLNDYPKIEGLPTYTGGKMELEKLIEVNLKISENAKDLVFRLNYIFTVTCEGKIKDFKTLGDPKASKLTNMKEIIEATSGNWIPAEKNGKAVDCIYFAQTTIGGNTY